MAVDMPLNELLAKRAKRIGGFLAVGDIVTLGFYVGDDQVERLPVLVTSRDGWLLRGEVARKPQSRCLRIGQVVQFMPAQVVAVEPYTWSESHE